MAPKKRVGEMLVDAGVIDEPKLRAALAHQRQWGVRLGQALVDLKLATEADVVRALSVKFGFGIAALDALEPAALERALALVPRDFAVRHNVFPMAADDETITVAISDPTNLAVLDELRFRTGRRVGICLGGDRELAGALRRHYPEAQAPQAEEAEEVALDLDISEHEMDAMFDPLGAGSNDARDARAAPAAHAASAATAPQAAPAAQAGRAGGVVAATSASRVPAIAAPRPAPTSPAGGPRPAAAPAPMAGWVPPAEAPVPPAPAMPASPGPVSGPRPGATPPGPGRPAGIRAPGVASGGPPGAPPPAPAVAGPRPPPPPAPRPAPPVAAPRSSAEGVALDAAGAAADAERDALAALSTPPVAAPIAPPVAAPPAASPPAASPASVAPAPAPPLTPREAAILAALERLAGGAHAEPELLKPAQAMAALARVLLRKGIVTERELLEELVRRPPAR